MEPFYIRQCAVDGMTGDQQRAWFEECAAQAKSEGAKLCRFTVSDDGGLLLVEGWSVQAHDVGDQGEPRWSLMKG